MIVYPPLSYWNGQSSSCPPCHCCWSGDNMECEGPEPRYVSGLWTPVEKLCVLTHCLSLSEWLPDRYLPGRAPQIPPGLPHHCSWQHPNHACPPSALWSRAERLHNCDQRGWRSLWQRRGDLQCPADSGLHCPAQSRLLPQLSWQCGISRLKDR